MSTDVGTARVLVIDDEEANLRLLHRVLYPTYTHIEMVSDARRIQDVLVEFSPDVVLVDLHMPHVSGLDVLEMVRNAMPADDYLPVVVITADVSHDSKRRALALGATDFLTKPIDVIEVALRVSNLARARLLHREVRDARLSLESAVAQRTMELSEANRRLSELIKAKDQFIASVSHELRTPLAVVVGLAAELRDRGAGFDAHEFGELLGMVVDQSAEVAYIIEDLLVAARADIDTLTIVPKEAELDAVVGRALAPLSQADRDSLEVDLAVTSITTDPVRLAQILRNLVTNAVRYGGPERGLVCRPQGRGFRIEVWDSGPPIPADDQRRIFEPYYSAHSSLGTPAAVGLGLTVSRDLAHRLGGELAYRHEGGRSVFSVYLPNEVIVIDTALVG
jgi:two-component system, sensor histidine kinase and response regulator